MALKKALEGLMGSKTVAQLRIQEHNEEALLTDIASFQRSISQTSSAPHGLAAYVEP